MDCRNITINKDKRIGNVIFIVEGRKTEPQIIKNIFERIFGFDVFKTYLDRDIIRLKKENDIYSKVVIVVNDKPQITESLTDSDYILNMFRLLQSNGLDPFNSAIYYLFDRDENSSSIVLGLLDKLTNSRDNDDYEMNGLLLLSYPCIEAFYMNCNEDDKKHNNRKDLKKYIKSSKYNNLNQFKLINGCNEFLRLLKENYNINLTVSDLDDFKNINKTIFNYEEQHYKEFQYYHLLSLIFVSLFDLGLIEIK